MIEEVEGSIAESGRTDLMIMQRAPMRSLTFALAAAVVLMIFGGVAQAQLDLSDTELTPQPKPSNQWFIQGGAKYDYRNLQSVCGPCQDEAHGSKPKGANPDGSPRDPNHPWSRE